MILRANDPEHVYTIVKDAKGVIVGYIQELDTKTRKATIMDPNSVRVEDATGWTINDIKIEDYDSFHNKVYSKGGFEKYSE